MNLTLLICSMPCRVMSVSMLDSMHLRNTSSSILSTTSSSWTSGADSYNLNPHRVLIVLLADAHLLKLVLIAVHDSNSQHQFFSVVIVEDAVKVVSKT